MRCAECCSSSSASDRLRWWRRCFMFFCRRSVESCCNTCYNEGSWTQWIFSSSPPSVDDDDFTLIAYGKAGTEKREKENREVGTMKLRSIWGWLRGRSASKATTSFEKKIWNRHRSIDEANLTRWRWGNFVLQLFFLLSACSAMLTLIYPATPVLFD